MLFKSFVGIIENDLAELYKSYAVYKVPLEFITSINLVSSINSLL